MHIKGSKYTIFGTHHCSFKEFDEHPFPILKGNLNLEGAKNWLMNLEELLQAMDCTEEQRVKYAAYKFSGKVRRWWYDRRDLLVMELGSKEAITWTRFKEDFYRKYSSSLEDNISRVAIRKRAKKTIG